VIWNHALVADVTKLVAHAARTGAQLINVNHSSHAFLAHTPGSLRRWLDACEAARQHAHVWSVSQCEMPPVTGCHRIRQVSCPVRLHQPRPYRPPHSPLRIAIAGRWCPTKNITNSLLAVARLQQLHPIELHVCVNPTDALERTLDLLNLHPSRLGHMAHNDWLEYLRTEADVLLQVSLTESYNMAATEAQQIGVPVIASATVHAADPELTVSDPNSTADITAKIQQAAADYRNYTVRAHQHGRASADQRNSEYQSFVELLAATQDVVPETR
jgi:glycosyltransferase involved in cell wall biosynthesis